MTPYERGHAAYHEGKRRETNPYADEDDVVAWDQGWHDAEEADRLARAESRNAGKGGAP